MKATDIRIGKAIKRIRLEKGWARIQLALMVGVTHQQLTKYELGTNRISCGRLEAIATGLNVSISDLFGCEVPVVQSEDDRLCLEIAKGAYKLSRPVKALVSTLVSGLVNANR